ncbi:MAG TPA: branched-chain amino acid transaminase [Candidatus Bathyarchaeia archaeon]|nr:branched-chain amino acid transaminase [Candidatus Bathyarchaeia archaeon]
MEKSAWIWLDGRFVPWGEANVHVLTHTLHYGLGVFEGIRCYRTDDGSSAVFRLPEHNRRLFDSAHILGLRIPYSREELAEACVETVRRNALDECYIRPLAFLGDGEMGLAATNPVRVAIAAWRWGAYLGDQGVKHGIRVKTSSFQRFHVNTFMPKAKAVGNYVNSILAAHEARTAGYEEALMLDTEGFVAEASGENLFIVRDGVVKTTPPTSILPGITRDTVLRLLLDRRLELREERITRDEVYIADEAFFTGTAVEVTPIREVDDRKIGGEGPGPLTRELQKEFFDIVRGRDPRRREWLTRV